MRRDDACRVVADWTRRRNTAFEDVIPALSFGCAQALQRLKYGGGVSSGFRVKLYCDRIRSQRPQVQGHPELMPVASRFCRNGAEAQRRPVVIECRPPIDDLPAQLADALGACPIVGRG